MCFSPTASFGSGIVLTGIGVATMTKVRTRNRLLFASIPFLFGVQQFAEGFVWMGLEDPGMTYVVGTATTVYLLFAHILWPSIVPLAVMSMEPQEQMRRRLRIPLLAGLLTSLYFAYCMVSYTAIASIDGYHIKYLTTYPDAPAPVVGLLYMSGTLAPFFLSSLRRTWLFGAAAALAYAFTYALYTEYIVSVWCFFAALLSMIVYLILYPPPMPQGHAGDMTAQVR
ncbi:MAG: DUF6629 family protein [Candidatus Kapaibacterium sp.]